MASSARSNAFPPADEAGLALQLHPLDHARDKATEMLQLTKANLEKIGKGPKTEHQKILLKEIVELSKQYVIEGHSVIKKEHCNADGVFILKVMSGDLAKLRVAYRLWIRGQWKTGTLISKTKTAFHRIVEQIKPLLEGKSPQEEADIVKQVSRICFTVNECLEMVESHPNLKRILERLVEISPAFQTCDGHEESKLVEATCYATELLCASVFHGTIGNYVMEKCLNMFSEVVHGICRLPPRMLNERPIQVLQGVQMIIVLLTWRTYYSAVVDYIKEHVTCEKTLVAIKAMIRETPKNGFLQNDIIQRMYPGANIFVVDALPTNDTFDVVEEVGNEIVSNIDSDDTPEEIQDTIRDCLDHIDNNSAHSKSYREPRQDVLSKAEENAVMEAISTATNSGKQKVLIVVENCLVGNLGKKFREETFVSTSEPISVVNATGRATSTIWETPHGGEQTQVVLQATSSRHVTFGHDNTYLQRTISANDTLTDMKVYEDAEIIPAGSTQKEQAIFEAAFGEMEGYDGTLPHDPQGSFYRAVRMAVPPGYFLNRIFPGVRALGNALSYVGLHDLHLVTLMAVQGYDNFALMMLVTAGVVIPEDPSDFPAFLIDHKAAFEAENRSDQYWAHKFRLEVIEAKPEEERSEEENELLEAAEAARLRHNEGQNKRRVAERQAVEAAKAKPENERNVEEKELLAKKEAARLRKNERQQERRAAERQATASNKRKASDANAPSKEESKQARLISRHKTAWDLMDNDEDCLDNYLQEAQEKGLLQGWLANRWNGQWFVLSPHGKTFISIKDARKAAASFTTKEISITPGPLGVGIQRGLTGMCIVGSVTNTASHLFKDDVIVSVNGFILRDVGVHYGGDTKTWLKAMKNIFQVTGKAERKLVVQRVV